MDFLISYLKIVAILVVHIHSINANVEIVGGGVASLGDVPYIVSVRVNDIHVCGGSIISPIYILTAAQCPFFSTDSANLTILSVQWGTLKINQSHDYTVIPVLRTIVHPNYNDETFENDIAILQLVQHITFGRNVKAVTLPAKNQKLPDMNGILAGWGDIDGNQTTSELYWAMTPVLASRQSCQKILSNETIYSCNICYGNVNDNIGQCVGDTGGPFTMKLRDEDDYLVGILSWFMVPCGSDPGVLTEVSQYRDWITDETGI